LLNLIDDRLGAEPRQDQANEWSMPGGPSNLRIKKVGANILEFGTIQFLAANGNPELSPRLKDLAQQNPDHTVRFAVDLESARDLINEGIATERNSIPRPVRPFLDLIPKISTVRLSLDSQDTTFLSLAIEANDEAAAKEVFEGLEALLGMAKLSINQDVPRLAETSPVAAEVFAAVSQSLNAEYEGRTVTLTIPRPALLDEAIEEGIAASIKAREDYKRLSRLRISVLGVLNYESAFERLPFGPVSGETSDAKLSWRARVWPFITEDDVSAGIDPSQDFDSQRNEEFAQKMPAQYGKGSSSHSDIFWVRPTKEITRLQEITDGMANTIMLVQGVREIPWMEPGDVTPEDVLDFFEMLGPNDALFVALYDGSVHRLPRSMEIGELRKMLDPSDGQAVEWPDQ
jgi:hypothetical protein